MSEDTSLSVARADLIGERVLARVTRVEHYGLYLRHEDIAILVLIPDVSLEPIDLRARYRVGDEVEVRIVRYVAEHGLFKGSLVA
ncbi:S1 RNA-binding domain-containing protein [Nannocystis sp. RBIL2]|uniref:S1 RNA-binding domain-containing protein n=1 Tax=Nannocystis sp. RBIL2 TaxID=2996788 RepID=UPI0022705812|nr:S1 RNA-binding domain-containing protein [Nannocystis sp. RBIL2]MCY1067115.1 S1 RNA-binding domain-containing protein [Nannocystis sp. RBIL2]